MTVLITIDGSREPDTMYLRRYNSAFDRTRPTHHGKLTYGIPNVLASLDLFRHSPPENARWPKKQMSRTNPGGTPPKGAA